MRMENRRFGNGIYLFDVKNRKDPMTMDKDERKRFGGLVVRTLRCGRRQKSFDDCLQEKTMEELCQSFAELFSKN